MILAKKNRLHKLCEDFVPVPVDKAANNIIVICKTCYLETLTKERGIYSLHQTSSTYIPSTDSSDKILKSHSDFGKLVGLKLSEEDQGYPSLYSTHKR